MRDVSVYLDLEWITTYLQERGFALTPALVAQQIKNSAHPFGSVRQMVAFGDPESITEGMRETLETEGFRFLPKSVEMLFDEKEEIDGHTNQTVILVSGGLRDPEPFKQIRRNGCDVVVWHGTDGSADNTQWDRTDTLDRILRLQIHGIGVYVDFEGLIAAVWDSKQCSMLRRFSNVSIPSLAWEVPSYQRLQPPTGIRFEYSGIVTAIPLPMRLSGSADMRDI